MKNLMAGLVVGLVLVPAAQVRHEETKRGADELINTVALSVQKSAAENHAHTWVKTAGYNFAQRYALQKDLQKNGYDLDMPLFGSTFVGW